MDNTNISVVMSDHKSLACSCKGLIWFDVAWPSTLFFHHLRCIDQNFQLTDSIQPNRQNMAHYKALNGCMSTSLRSISLICSKSGLPAIHPYWWIRLGQQFSCAALADWTDQLPSVPSSPCLEQENWGHSPAINRAARCGTPHSKERWWLVRLYSGAA